MQAERIILGADHAGFALKECIKSLLADMGLEVTDAGPQNPDPVDYPDYGRPVAAAVSCGDYTRGILICGSGVGMTIVANKYPRVRAALCLDEETAASSRRHNDANILCLAGRKTAPEAARRIVQTWMETAFEGGRHRRRIEKIQELEQEICRQAH